MDPAIEARKEKRRAQYYANKARKLMLQEQAAGLIPSFYTFHSFSKLPPEIRLRIWKFSMLPRLLAFKSSSTLGLHCASPNFKPPILYANSESRKEGLKFYRILHPAGTPLACRVYFNAQIDTVLCQFTYNNYSAMGVPVTDMECKLLRGIASPINRVRYLALPWGLFVDMRVRKQYYFAYRAARSLKTLEELTLVRYKKPKRAARFEILSMADTMHLPKGESNYDWFVNQPAWRSRAVEEQRQNPEWTVPELRFVEIKYTDTV